MPLRLILAYALIGALVVLFSWAFLHLTRERRSYGRAMRQLERSRDRSRRDEAKLAARED